MICPNCQNEKLQEKVCSYCGLDENTALLKAAERYREQERNELALRSYDQYLALEPGDLEVARKAALLSCSLALNLKDPVLYEKADQTLARLLEAQWDWQAGHENRLSLAISFGKTASLLQAYKTVREKDPSRVASCDKMIKTVQLAEKFQGEKPAVPQGLDEIDLKSVLIWNLWVLVAGFLMATLIKEFLIPANYANALSWPTASVLCFALYAGWTIFRVWHLQRLRNKANAPKLELTLKP